MSTYPEFDGTRCPMCGADNTLQAGPTVREYVGGLPGTSYRPRSSPAYNLYHAHMLCAHCGHTWVATITP